MTINYSYSCSKSGLGTFLKLLVRWRGSIYKLIYKESLLYLAVFYALSFTYKFALTGFSKGQFERLVVFCNHSSSMIPITFILGFYVAQVVQRWWEIFLSIAWPDNVNFVKLWNKLQLLVLRDITAAVRKRFPTLDHLVEAGFFTVSERDKYEKTECSHHKYWIPIHWSHVLLCRAKQKGFIASDHFLQKCIEGVYEYKACVGTLLSYDWIPIPLGTVINIYTNVLKYSTMQ